MNSEAALMFSGLKFISGDSEHVCRLCLACTENVEVSVFDSVKIEKPCVEETNTFMDMFDSLGVHIEEQLPQVLCMECANSVINAYIFSKLCQYSNSKWNKIFERLQESLIQSELINPTSKAAYIMFNDNERIIYSSRTIVDSKKAALSKIKNILRAKTHAQKEKMKLNECEDCNVTFSSRMRLLKHVKDKHNVTCSQGFPCPQCARSFTTKLHLKYHKERMHYPKTIQCAQCAKMFATETMLKRHENIYHTAAICKLCFIQFPSKLALRAHLDKHGVHKCEKCNKTYINRHTYKLHMKTCGSDTREPKFFCDLCKKGFVRKNSLRTHLKVNHGFGTFLLSCSWCKRKFDAISRLKAHIVKHTRERNFCCSQCGGKFVTQAALVYHTRLHTGEKPFPCDLCDESFLSASRRMEHKRRKHWAPTKQCSFCPAKFVTSSELKKHSERHTRTNSKLYVPLEPCE